MTFPPRPESWRVELSPGFWACLPILGAGAGNTLTARVGQLFRGLKKGMGASLSMYEQACGRSRAV